jgi:hypothetical protein
LHRRYLAENAAIIPTPRSLEESGMVAVCGAVDTRSSTLQTAK